MQVLHPSGLPALAFRVWSFVEVILCAVSMAAPQEVGGRGSHHLAGTVGTTAGVHGVITAQWVAGWHHKGHPELPMHIELL